mmetsp:Transcript_1366/g.3039  ORF Transcript_1366/g.3039 Transcript_1366/m.3039 type:complete len:230 (+) Transcript_1366:291-980(+)
MAASIFVSEVMPKTRGTCGISHLRVAPLSLNLPILDDHEVPLPSTHFKNLSQRTATWDSSSPPPRLNVRRSRRRHTGFAASSSQPISIGEPEEEVKELDTKEKEREYYEGLCESSTWNLFHRLSRSRGSSSPSLLSPTDFDRLEQTRLSAGPPGSVATSSSTNNSGSEAVDEGDAEAGCVFSFDTEQEFDSPQLFAPEPPRGGGGVARVDPMDRALKRAEMLARREYQG